MNISERKPTYFLGLTDLSSESYFAANTTPGRVRAFRWTNGSRNKLNIDYWRFKSETQLLSLKLLLLMMS